MSVAKFYNIGKKELYPICRSITGNGLRKSLKIIKKHFPSLIIKKIKSGTKVYDWKVPPEWQIDDAYIKDKYNKKIINFKKNNLHVLGYSQPINKFLKRDMLLKNLYSLKKQPDAIPYITSYYKKHWGFCLTDNDKTKIISKYKKEDLFKVVIKSKFKSKGFLNFGEIIVKGKTNQEILISTNICHPSMANNELSGPIILMSLIEHLKKKKLNKTMRFLFIPETIGAISYLNKNLNKLKNNVIGGYNLSCIGDDRMHSCIFTKYENSQSDKSLVEAYKKLKISYKVYSFLQRGSDERQYNSPGVDLPIALISRSKFLEYPEYHTSLDDFKLVTIKGLLGGYKVAKKAIEILQKKIIPLNSITCEPQMSRRSLYPTLSIKYKKKVYQNLMNFLQYADGKNNLIEIAKILKLGNKQTKEIYNILLKNKLVK